MLEKEVEKYHQVKGQLLLENPEGGFVVIKDEVVFGVWHTRKDALEAGLDKFGDVEFLVKDIKEGIVAANYSRELKFI